MIIGYARISTLDQNPNLQMDALEKAGCEKMFIDNVRGTVDERPRLEEIKSILQKGDKLVVWRLDKLALSLKDLIEWMNYLQKEGVALKSLEESLDTSTASGELIYRLFEALLAFEINLTHERTQSGLSTARARGRVGGRPQALSEEKREAAISLYNEKKLSVMEICKTMRITKPTLYRYIKNSQKKSSKNLKKVIFHNSFEEQRLFGQRPTFELTIEQRLEEMYRLNKKLFGDNRGKLTKEIKIFKALPGEGVNDFYKRINSDG